MLIELQKSQKMHNKIIQRQLQMSMIKKYLKKKIINLLADTSNQPSKFNTKIGSKKMTSDIECITLIAKLNLKRRY